MHEQADTEYHIVRELVIDDDRDVFLPLYVVATFATYDNAMRVCRELNLNGSDSVCYSVMRYVSES